MERKCHMYFCRRLIIGCFGFVRAKDHLDYVDGKRKNIRELCGVCVERVMARYFKIPKGELF